MDLAPEAAAIALAALVAAVLAGLLWSERRRGARLAEAHRRAEAARLEARERTRLAIDHLDEAFVAVSPDGEILEWNRAAERLFGRPRSAALGRPAAELLRPASSRDPVPAWLSGQLGGAEPTARILELTACDSEGNEFPAEVELVPMRSGESWSVHAFFEDITERQVAAERHARLIDEARAMARVDTLTGLPNRRAWEEDLEREVARSRRRGGRMCVAMLDFDHFRAFNESNGHAAGDRLLQGTASAWRAELRAGDVIARYGGEEFAVLLPDCPLGAARDVVDRLRAAVGEGQTASAGIADWDGREPAEALAQRAEGALYRAKHEGRDRVGTAARTPRAAA